MKLIQALWFGNQYINQLEINQNGIRSFLTIHTYTKKEIMDGKYGIHEEYQ